MSLYKMISPEGVIETHNAANKHDLEMHLGWKVYEKLASDVDNWLSPQEILDSVGHAGSNKSALEKSGANKKSVSVKKQALLDAIASTKADEDDPKDADNVGDKKDIDED